MTAYFRHPTGRRFYRDPGGAGTVSRDTAREAAGVNSDAELDALVVAREIGPPIMSSMGERFFIAELRAYAERKRHTRKESVS